MDSQLKCGLFTAWSVSFETEQKVLQKQEIKTLWDSFKIILNLVIWIRKNQVRIPLKQEQKLLGHQVEGIWWGHDSHKWLEVVGKSEPE